MIRPLSRERGARAPSGVWRFPAIPRTIAGIASSSEGTPMTWEALTLVPAIHAVALISPGPSAAR